MLNRGWRLHHSSRVRLPSNQHVCKLVLGANIFDLDFRGPQLIRSSNRSNATLWVLDTCLTIGLRLLIIILITASLSSKMYNRDSPWEECVLVGTWSTSLHRCSFRCEFVVVPVSSCDDLWSFACGITALNVSSRLLGCAQSGTAWTYVLRQQIWVRNVVGFRTMLQWWPRTLQTRTKNVDFLMPSSRASLKHCEKDVGWIHPRTSALQVISTWNWEWSWRLQEIDVWDMMKEFNCKAFSTRSICGRERANTVTHRHFESRKRRHRSWNTSRNDERAWATWDHNPIYARTREEKQTTNFAKGKKKKKLMDTIVLVSETLIFSIVCVVHDQLSLPKGKTAWTWSTSLWHFAFHGTLLFVYQNVCWLHSSSMTLSVFSFAESMTQPKGNL